MPLTTWPAGSLAAESSALAKNRAATSADHFAVALPRPGSRSLDESPRLLLSSFVAALALYFPIRPCAQNQTTSSRALLPNDRETDLALPVWTNRCLPEFSQVSLADIWRS